MTSLTMALMWLVLAVILGILEAITVDLVAIWFAFGSVCAMFASLFDFSFAVQMVCFFAFSIISLVVMKPFCKKILKTRKTATNADSTVGMVGTVTENIDCEGNKGRVFVNGLDWKASSFDGVPIEKGEKVVVKSIRGVTVEVERI